MRLKKLTAFDLKLAEPADGYVRTPGFHASDLYSNFYKATDPKRYDKRDKAGEPQPMDLARLEFGLSFEQELEDSLLRIQDNTRKRMAGRLLGARPGEFTAPHDERCSQAHKAIVMGVPCEDCAAGTIFSPDYLFTAGDETILGEFKTTWMTSRGAPMDPKYAKYWSQTKLYCHWLGIRKVWLFVYFVNADYAPPSPSFEPGPWEATFTQQELRDEYDVLVKFARKKGLLTAK